MASCRSCGAAIFWAVTTNGKSMPVDRDPVDVGNVEVTWPPDPSQSPLATVHAQQPLGSTAPLYLSHFATCVNAADHRNPR